MPKTSTQTFSHKAFFREPFGSWTSAPKIVDVRPKKCFFLRPPPMGRNFLTLGHPGVRVRNVLGKSGPKSLCLCCFSSLNVTSRNNYTFWSRPSQKRLQQPLHQKYLVNLLLTNLVRISAFSSLFSAIAVFLALSGNMMLKVLRSLRKERKTQKSSLN